MAKDRSKGKKEVNKHAAGGGPDMGAEIAQYEEKMKKAIELLRSDLASVRAGRPDPKTLDKIAASVSYSATPVPINQLSNITVEQGRNLIIAPWDSTVLKAIEKAILASDLGINPSNDGKIIRLVFPELSEERRKVLSKEVKTQGEEKKLAIRNIRRDAMDAFKKQEKKSEMTEDDYKALEREIQRLTDKYIKETDKVVEDKTKEIMTF